MDTSLLKSLGMIFKFRNIFVKFNYFHFFALTAHLKHENCKSYISYE